MTSYSSIPTAVQADSKELEVREHEAVSADDEASLPVKQRQNRSLRQRLGNWSLCMLLGSTLALVLVVAFLAMLWQFGWDPETNNKLARAIASAKWMIKATTLSAVILRLAVAVQAGVCTSLAAALLLEGNGVPLPDVLHFAALRSFHSAPPTILYPIMARVKLYVRSLPAIVIVVVFLTATACQLASTILVTDMRIGTIEGKRQDALAILGTDVNNSLSNFVRGGKIDYWGSRPISYPIFGESSKPARSGEHEHDTGATYQGMIPIQNTTERALRHFEGLTSVFGSRVECVAPSIEATVQYHPAFTYRYLVGNATYPRTGKGLLSCLESNTTETFAAVDLGTSCTISFNCTIPYPNSWAPSNFSSEAENEDPGPPPINEWYMGICAISRGSRWGFESSLSDVPYAEGGDVGSGRTDIMMVLNHTDHTPKGLGPQSNTSTVFRTAADSKGEWSSYDLLNDGMVDLSLCFAELNTDTRRVEMSTPADLLEPVVTWDNERRTYDTWELQRQFNTSGRVRDKWDRRVMDMRFLDADNTTDIPVSSSVDFTTVVKSDLYKFSKPGKAGTYIPVCTLCEGILDEFSIKVHPVTSTLFYDIVKSTRHPALGLQAIFSTLVQSAYIEELPSYNVRVPAKVRLSVQSEYPYRWLGFMVVVLILTLHLSMVGLLVWLFARRTKESLIGELWHSVGQVMNDVPEGLWSQQIGKTEDEIRVACRTSGLDKRVVGLAGSTRAVPIELRERDA
jgi:hypothetical protein